MKIARRKREETETPASAMSDIAFLLIVFFMVIAVFTVKEGFIIKTPESEKTIKKSSNDILKVKIVGKDFFVSDKKTDKKELIKEIKTEKEDKKSVVLEIDQKTLYQEVIFVLDVFAKLKILDFSMKKIEGGSQ
ncbi:MAG TPA: hypothetical protein DHW82_12780 [Spirochaetia bacterium]|nr:MAG: hypothetical protein A2Y41_03240 [Spirochaetes bacterium GWB1_36_13]HCL57864.1 hypothetical protein [Spirochaetia bacterium]